MSTRLISLTLGTVLTMAAGCADPKVPSTPSRTDLPAPGLVAVRLAVTELRAAQEVEVVFTNGSSTNLGVNTCERRVDRLVNGQWVAYPEELRICTASLPALPAQGSLTTTADVPIDAVPGEHRFRFVVRQAAAPTTVSELSASFTVR